MNQSRRVCDHVCAINGAYMDKPLLAVAVAFIIVATVSAQKPAWQPEPGHTTINLWPNGAPGAQPNPPAEVDLNNPEKDKTMAGRPIIRLGNVSNPTLTVYAPKDHGSDAAIVVFPGGAYRILAIDLEGTEVCEWLNSIHVTCVLVKYRVPDSG